MKLGAREVESTGEVHPTRKPEKAFRAKNSRKSLMKEIPESRGMKRLSSVISQGPDLALQLVCVIGLDKLAPSRPLEGRGKIKGASTLENSFKIIPGKLEYLGSRIERQNNFPCEAEGGVILVALEKNDAGKFHLLSDEAGRESIRGLAPMD